MNHQLLHIVLITLVILSHQEANAAEQTLPAHTPKTCVGFVKGETTKNWGSYGVVICPKNYAVYGIAGSYAPTRYSEGKLVSVGEISCCPLPAEDILTNEKVFATSKCPEDHIVTSATIDPDTMKADMRHAGQSHERFVQCTRINTKRYKLGSERLGARWGRGASSWKEQFLILRGDIPLAIRPGIGRHNKYHWVAQGCVGIPIGSLFTGKTSKRCHGMRFKSLLFSGLPGDPPAGTEVKMFPQCESSPEQFNPEGPCVGQR